MYVSNLNPNIVSYSFSGDVENDKSVQQSRLDLRLEEVHIKNAC